MDIIDELKGLEQTIRGNRSRNSTFTDREFYHVLDVIRRSYTEIGNLRYILQKLHTTMHNGLKIEDDEDKSEELLNAFREIIRKAETINRSNGVQSKPFSLDENETGFFGKLMEEIDRDIVNDPMSRETYDTVMRMIRSVAEEANDTDIVQDTIDIVKDGFGG